MRISAIVLVILVPFTVVSADPTARVAQVEGTVGVLLPGQPEVVPATPGQALPAGAQLSAADGGRAEIELAGLGVLELEGPATATLSSTDGIPTLVLLSGEASFHFGAGEVVLEVRGGRLRLRGIAGYEGALIEGTSLGLAGDGESVEVTVRRGNSLLSRAPDHVRILEGDSVRLPGVFATAGGNEVRLYTRHGVLHLPPDSVEGLAGSSNPYLDELADDWGTQRESPRIP